MELAEAQEHQVQVVLQVLQEHQVLQELVRNIRFKWRKRNKWFFRNIRFFRN
jgi:hypothetical protein